MIIKKIFVLVLSFILITLLFCACGNVTMFDNNDLDNSTPSSQSLEGTWATDDDRFMFDS